MSSQRGVKSPDECENYRSFSRSCDQRQDGLRLPHGRHGKQIHRRHDREWDQDRAHWEQGRKKHKRYDREWDQDGSQWRPLDSSLEEDNLSREQPRKSVPGGDLYASEAPFDDSITRADARMSPNNFPAALNPEWEVNFLDSMALTQTPENRMFDMMGMGNYWQIGTMSEQENLIPRVRKEVVKLTKSILYPPHPNAPPPTTRAKPPGCKTVFVGGLPVQITEEIIQEVFERCGEIQTIRMHIKQSFCHIRFASEDCVENALYFSGYRMKIKNQDDSDYIGHIHVDYARARDDQYEYECQQRAIQREAHLRKRMEEELLRIPTPPPIVRYTEHEATLLVEKLRSEETFVEAAFILISWLERGECKKRNASSFYSMIQSANSHVRHLMNEKVKCEEELNKAKLMFQQQMQGMLIQFNEITKVFNAACLQKVWDHFTKAQRKNIEIWKKQSEEVKSAHVEEVLNDRVEDEMDVSEEEDEQENHETSYKSIPDSSTDLKDKLEAEITKLREENDALHCQKSGTEQELELKERQIQALQQALQNSTEEVKALSQKRSLEDTEVEEFRAYKSQRNLDKGSVGSNAESTEIDPVSLNSNNKQVSFCEKEARLIGLICTFLNVHPFGANIDYICSYLHQIDPTFKVRDVENLMRRFPALFREVSTGIGASLGKKWKLMCYEL